MGKGEGKGEGPIGSACTCVGLLGELLCDCARCKCEEALKDFICIPVKFMCAAAHHIARRIDARRTNARRIAPRAARDARLLPAQAALLPLGAPPGPHLLHRVPAVRGRVARVRRQAQGRAGGRRAGRRRRPADGRDDGEVLAPSARP